MISTEAVLFHRDLTLYDNVIPLRQLRLLFSPGQHHDMEDYKRLFHYK